MDTLTKYLTVAAGSARGGLLRYYLGGTLLARTAAPFPAATFVVNVTGTYATRRSRRPVMYNRAHTAFARASAS